MIAGSILLNVLTNVFLVVAINWIGKAYGIHELTLQLLIGYVFLPRGEILRGSQLLVMKLALNQFVVYLGLCSTPSLPPVQLDY